MGRRCLPGSLNARRMWKWAGGLGDSCPLIAIPAVVADPSSWTDLRYRGPGQHNNCTPAGSFWSYRRVADVRVRI